MPVAPELVERFRADLEAICGDDGERKLGIAFSGGPDSLALLLLAHAAYPGRVEAATVDHGLRPESVSEAAHAARICRELGVHHDLLSVHVASGNVQSQARRARYAALGEWCDSRAIENLCTAHHADDQAETFLMRANRGSGAAGLAGVRPLGRVPETDIFVLRPLLQWRRTALENIVRESGFEAVLDPSNEDDRFDRVKMRKGLASCDFITVDGLARSAALLAKLETDIDGLVLEECARAEHEDGAPSHYRPFARSQVERPVIWAEVVRKFCATLGANLTRSEAAQMVEALLDGRAENIAGIQARGVGGDDDIVWNFAPENPRRAG